jgi:predicted kinase
MEPNTLILTVGLPRSGKTTWALERCAYGIPIVNPDSIRLALHGKPFVPEAEPFVWAIARVMVHALFLAGHDDVIVDATNTTRKRRDDWKSSKWRRQYKVFDTSADECRRRAEETNRPDLIPVIDRMAAAFEPVGEDETP